MKTLNTRLWADQPPAETPHEPVHVPAPVPSRADKRAARRTERASNRAAKSERRTARRTERASDRAAKSERRTARRAGTRAAKVRRPSRAYRLRVKLEKKLREKATEPATTPDARAGLMGVSRRGALIAITLLDLAATAVSFGESWDALFQWATRHGLSGFWAFVFPLQIDTFIAMGELALFIAILDHWHWKNRLWAWVSVFGGLVLSMAGNVGHVTGHAGSWQITAAVPPVAAMAGMFIGFQVLKRVMNPTAAAVSDQETADVISQLRHQVEELSRRPEPVDVPEPRREIEPGQFFMEDRPEPATGFQVPEPVKPAPRPRARKGGRHERWDEAVKLYRDSIAEVATGERDKPYSQRELAAALRMQNRQLASLVIKHVENGGE